jgi:hypothetical protein
MKYKINLDKVWSEPSGTGYFKSEGTYCAVGLVMNAANVKMSETGISEESNDFFVSLQDKGFDPWVVAFDFDREVRNNPENKEMIREKYVRKILQAGLELGIFELEGQIAPTLIKEGQYA